MMPLLPIKKKTRRAVVVIALSTTVLAALDRPCAFAQTVLDTVTLYQEPSIRPDTPVMDTRPTAEPSTPVRDVLRYLPATYQTGRLDRESAALQWLIAMTASEARDTKRFRLSYTSAASVLPDVSRLTLFINGTQVGRVGIAAPGDVRPIEFDIARSGLHEGLNTIRLTADQRHRVDCSVDATYELWTDVDFARTGFVTSQPALLTKLTDLAALRFRADGAMVIRMRADGPMSPSRVDDLIRAAQAVALIGAYRKVIVSLARDDEAAFGLNVIVGKADPQVRVVAASASPSVTPGPRLLLQNDRVGVAPTLIVNGANDDDITRSIADLIGLAETMRRERAIQSDRTDWTGSSRTLADFSVSDTGVAGRFARIPINFQMPADLLAADYGKLAIDLIGTTVGDLATGAQLQIMLNGRNAVSVPLSHAAGPFHHRDIAIPLGGLRPGRNTIEIAALLPDFDRAACGSNASLDGIKKSLVLSAHSKITMPALARIGQLPNLSQTAAGGFPLSIPASRPKLYVPAPDRDTMAAAMTVAVQMSIVAGRPIAFETVISNPAAHAGHGLLVAPARALDPDAMQAIGMDPDAVQRVWEARAEAAADSKTNAREPTLFMPSSPARSMPSQFGERMASAVRGWFGRALTTSQAIDPATSLIVAQGLRSDDTSNAITLVTAPNAVALRSSVEALMTPSKWLGLRGRLTLMDESANVLESVAASNVHFVETQPTSIGNTRLIVAGWLSIHPGIYTMSALLLAALFAFATRALVKNVGRRNAQ